MKIQNKKLNSNCIGSPVIYVPYHVHGDISHKDCEKGTISSYNKQYVFVKYTNITAATRPENLIWG